MVIMFIINVYIYIIYICIYIYTYIHTYTLIIISNIIIIISSSILDSTATFGAAPGPHGTQTSRSGEGCPVRIVGPAEVLLVLIYFSFSIV